jgi:hypothetical protein
MVLANDRRESDVEDQAVTVNALRLGYRLFQYETEVGQLVWEWRSDLGFGPRFLHRRVAIEWMHDRLQHEDASPPDLLA